MHGNPLMAFISGLLTLECVPKHAIMCAVVRTTYELQQAQLADPTAALQYEHQLATQAAEPIDIEYEPSPAPQAEATPQLDPAYSLPHPNARESTERQVQRTEDTNAPGTSAAHSRPASLGWGRLKKVKLAAKADGSQDVGSKRKRDADTGGYAKLLCMCRLDAHQETRLLVLTCPVQKRAGMFDMQSCCACADLMLINDRICLFVKLRCSLE